MKTGWVITSRIPVHPGWSDPPMLLGLVGADPTTGSVITWNQFYTFRIG